MLWNTQIKKILGISQTKGKLNIISKNLIEDSKKNIIVMGRNTQLSIEDRMETISYLQS